MQQQNNDPLHGKTLQVILEELLPCQFKRPLLELLQR
jgi:uncharacterized protein (DUF2132 family)